MEAEKIEVTSEVREYMAALGRRQTPAKIEAAARNLEKGRRARLKDPLTLPCTCTGGDSLKVTDHRTTCPRGRLLWQRERTAAKRNKAAA